MREILFKAKRIDNGEWIIGSLIKTKKDYYICEKPYECMGEYSSLNGQSYGFGGFKFVDPSTICQYTGLTDKHGQKIWENDVVYMRCNGLSGYGNVIYENGCFWIDDKKRGRKYPFSNHDVKYRVDGNVFDNPELLSE